MEQRVMHGATLDFVTPDELYRAIPRPSQVTRIRQTAQVALDATGKGQDEVYKVPSGYEFAGRRVSMYLTAPTGAAPIDPNTNNVVLNAAGKGVAYLRSGAFIEWAQPMYGSSIQVPGSQTWGDQQGPYLRNAEVFEVFAIGLTASAILTVILEGLLHLPGTDSSNGHRHHALS